MRQKSHLVILGSFMFNFFICDRRVTKFTPKIDFKKKIIARKFQAKSATMTEIQLVQNWNASKKPLGRSSVKKFKRKQIKFFLGWSKTNFLDMHAQSRQQ